MTACELRGVTVALGGVKALDDVTLSIERNSVVGLFGQNGAGKTTLIRAACGVINRFTGSIDPRGATVGYLPDEPFLFRDVTLAKHIQMCAQLFDDFDAGLAGQMIDELGLDKDLKISRASRGMSEQVHLAFVLARRCELYFFDEPLAAVDPLTRDSILDMIEKYRSPGSTVVISTHLIAGLEALFDDVVVLHKGRLLLHEKSQVVAANGGLEERFKEVVHAGRI